MKATFKWMLILICIIPLTAKAQKSDILNVINEQAMAWNKGDLEGFMKGYWEHDSLRFIGKKGITYGWKPVLENYQKTYGSKEKMVMLDFNEINIQLLSKNSAFVVGHWKVTADVVQEGYFSLLFSKKDGKWVIVCDHTS